MKRPHYLFSDKQTGSTLLEILVSVFVLGFGLLALVSMQLKTVTSAREAENQTIIAQAADSFIEGMMMNPARSIQEDGEIAFLVRDFSEYQDLVGNDIDKDCDDDAVLSLTGAAGTDEAGVDKDAVAKAHVCTFVKRISQIPSSGKVNWNICQEEPSDAAQTPSFTGSGATKTIACGGSGSLFVLKVIWEQELEDSEQYQNADITLNENNTAVVYTYQAPIGQ